MDSKLLLPIILQVLGVGVVIAEFLLPSGGLLMLTAVGAFGYSLYYVFVHISAETGMYFIAADAILIPLSVVVGIKLISKSRVTLRKSLTKESGVSSQDAMMELLTGKIGTALTDLRPAGKAFIAGRRMDVVTTGDYIVKGSPISVTGVSGNRIVVRAAEGTNGGCPLTSHP